LRSHARGWLAVLTNVALVGLALPSLVFAVRNRDLLTDYGALRATNARYQQDVRLLASVPGPALFEDPLLGFDAGKPFLFDPFNGTQLMVAGRLPEQLITDALQARCFAAVALYADLSPRVRQLAPAAPESSKATASIDDRWTDNVLRILNEQYALVEPGRSRWAYIYAPQGPPSMEAPACRGLLRAATESQ
jgi:hypothetical protein